MHGRDGGGGLLERPILPPVGGRRLEIATLVQAIRQIQRLQSGAGLHEPEATAAALWELLIERAERDHETIGHPVCIDDEGASVPAWTYDGDELTDADVVAHAAPLDLGGLFAVAISSCDGKRKLPCLDMT